jgi:hypothetical protein
MPTPSPVPTEAPVIDITLVSDGPVVEGGEGCGATLPAAYFANDEGQHLYMVCFGDLPGDQEIRYGQSPDGASWAFQDQPEPLRNLPIEFSPPGAVPGDVISVGDEWVMYFWGVPFPQRDGAQIYRATSADPGGPWVADPEPVVPVGGPGEVDDLGIDFPSVVESDDGFLMLYGANGGDRPHAARILAATSADGITWEKHGRVIEPEACGGDAMDYVAIPRLFVVDDGFLVLTLLGNDIAALRSTDGLTWECIGDGPVFEAPEIAGSERVHTIAAAQDDSGIHVLIEALFTPEGESVYSNLWLAEVTGL